MAAPKFIVQVEVQDHQGAPMGGIIVEALDSDEGHANYPGGPPHYQDYIFETQTTDNQGLATFTTLDHPRFWFRPREHRHPDVRIQVLSYVPAEASANGTSVSISLGALPRQCYYGGPFVGLNGAWYSIILTTGFVPIVFKSTDSGATHTEMNAAGKPVNTALFGLVCGVFNNKIYMAACPQNNANRYFHVFNMTTDLWETIDEVITGTGYSAVASSLENIAMVVRTDGTVVAAYTDAGQDAQSRIRAAGGGWSAETAIDVGTLGKTMNWAVLNASDNRVHFFWVRGSTPAKLRHRSLSGANVLDAIADIDTTTFGDNSLVGRPVTYPFGGVVRVIAPYARKDTLPGDTASRAVRFTSEANPVYTLITPIAANDVYYDPNAGSGPAICLANFAATVFAAFAQRTDRDIYVDKSEDEGNFGADTERVDAVSNTMLCCNVISDPPILAIIYDNAGTVYFQLTGITVSGFTPLSDYLQHDHSPGNPTQVDHADLLNVTSDQHHAKAHDHTAADGSGVLTAVEIDSYIEGSEIADPAAPAANKGRFYFRDDGAGKTQLVVRFPTGAIQVIATEP